MTRYKLLKDLPTHKAGTIFEKRNGGLYDPKMHQYLYNMGTVECFSMVGTWFEEIEESEAFTPNEGEMFYYLMGNGTINGISYDSEFDKHNDKISIGNCFRTHEDAEKALEKLWALRRLREKGLEFGGWEWDNSSKLGESFYPIIHARILRCESFGEYEQIKRDLDLLFTD